MRGLVTSVSCALLILLVNGACSSKGDDAPGSGAPTCDDHKRNGKEVGVDCGGDCPKLCDGAKCSNNDACASGSCLDVGTCAATIGKVCGVGLPNACENGAGCSQDADCKLDVCSDDLVCIDPPDGAHSDGRRNAGETGIDCGGVVASTNPCPPGEGCKTNDDCQALCKEDGTCDDPSPTDGKKDGDETDVDCGGTVAPKCLLGQACAKNDDCDLLACTNNVCVTPTETDGIQNGGETDVDCGGPGVSAEGVSYLPPRCAFDKACAVGTDCLGGGCGAGKCTIPSCDTTETAGIATCGQGETGQAGSTHESCCKSLVMPSKTTKRLDKYEITAGRYRTFLTKVGPDIRSWAQSYASTHPQSQLAQVLNSFPSLKTVFPAADRLANLSLTAHLSIDIDNYDGIRGCYNGYGSYGANTYWQDDTHLADFGIGSRVIPRTTSDEKSLNCQMPIMLAAFCAWDGDAQLPTYNDYLDVWPQNQVYPWGNTNYCTQVGDTSGGRGPFLTMGGTYPCGAFNWCNGDDHNGGFRCQNVTQSPNGIPGMLYLYPKNTDLSKDNEPLIGAPGRFPKDQTSVKSSNGETWFDLMANLAEYTGDFASNPNANLNTFCDFSAGPVAGQPTCTRNIPGGGTRGPGTLHSNIPQIGIVGDTWEGHQYVTATVHGTVASNLPATFQYGKFGARCVRPAAKY